MPIAKILMSLLLIAPFIKGCSIIKEHYFSYRVGTYTLDATKQFIYRNDLISYGDYLFEFKNRENIITNIRGTEETTTEFTDTIGVFLLSKNMLYYEFDTFTLKPNLIKIGRLRDKQYGFKFKFPPKDSLSNVSYTSPIKNVINNIECFISEIVSNKPDANDSIKQEVVLLKNNQLNSLYKMNGVRFSDNNYRIVGFRIYDLKNRLGFLQDIESLRPLTEKEMKICDNMIKMSNVPKRVSEGFK